MNRARNRSNVSRRGQQAFSLAVAVAVALCSAAQDALAQTSPTVDVTVDATSSGSPLERIWAFHGYDEINYTTVAEGQALLRTLGMIHTTPPHIRTHFYLNTGDGTPSMKWGSTNVYTLGTNGMPQYNWTLMDGITDGLTSAGTLPLVEIGFMPHDLSTHPDPYMNSTVTTLDGGCFYPPKDYTAWGTLISTWATHTATRYPMAATTWQWELWNEPDIGYWHGTAAEYDKLFDYTEAALHSVLPDASLGGPASANPTSNFIAQFLQHCSTGMNAVSGKTGARLDMISFHAKGGTAIVNGNVEMDMGHQLTLHRTGFSTVASFAQYKKTPIVITEGDPDGCAACQTAADTYRRVPAYGAYEVEMMKRSLDLETELGINLRGIVAWAFLFPNQPYFADYRVLSTYGLSLPVLNAFKLLGSLKGMRLPVTSSGALALDGIVANGVRAQPDIDAMAATDSGQVQVLVWNYHDDIVTAPAAPIHLAVKVPASFGLKATVTHLRMDDSHGNPYSTWQTQGSPAAPTAMQLTQLKTSANNLTLQPAQEVDVVGGAVALDFDLPRFGVSLVTLTPAAAVGADASTPPANDAAVVETQPDSSEPDAATQAVTDSGLDSASYDDSAASQGAGEAADSSALATGDMSVEAGPDAEPSGGVMPGSGDAASATPQTQPSTGGCACRTAASGDSVSAGRSASLALFALYVAAAVRRKRGTQAPRRNDSSAVN